MFPPLLLSDVLLRPQDGHVAISLQGPTYETTHSAVWATITAPPLRALGSHTPKVCIETSLVLDVWTAAAHTFLAKAATPAAYSRNIKRYTETSDVRTEHRATTGTGQCPASLACRGSSRAGQPVRQGSLSPPASTWASKEARDAVLLRNLIDETLYTRPTVRTTAADAVKRRPG